MSAITADTRPVLAAKARLRWDRRTSRYLLLYPRHGNESWAEATARAPRFEPLPWLPQAEALGWSPDGRHLYVTGEFIPAPLYRITP